MAKRRPAPLATSWHSNKFLNPVHDGAVLPILHLNGYKIAGPTVLARIPREELAALFRGYGYTPTFCRGRRSPEDAPLMAATLDRWWPRSGAFSATPAKGLREAAPLADDRPAHAEGLDGSADRGRKADGRDLALAPGAHGRHEPSGACEGSGIVDEELPAEGAVRQGPSGLCVRNWPAFAPTGERRMSANPHANGGLLLRDLRLPDFRDYAVKVPKPGAVDAEATRVQGEFVRDVSPAQSVHLPRLQPGRNLEPLGRRVRGHEPCSMAAIVPGDEHVGPDGRVMEMLSEHQCEGWLEGYLLTGRHGFFSCYEAFIHIVDSMFNQHAKWLDVTRRDSLAPPDRLAELPALVACVAAGPQRFQPPGPRLHRCRGQQEGFRSSASTCRPTRTRCFRDGSLPAQPRLRERDRGRKAAKGRSGWTWMPPSSTAPRAFGIWEWASNDRGGEPDVVMACCGDVPTLETLAAVQFLRAVPELKIRVVNVVDLMKLQPQSEHPHGLSDGISTRCSPPTSRSSSPTTAIRG
jgi:xylulose-5-phosphate/fructose-6-phosphate phosphoketolase